jgi:NADH-quinone oxidoreductase subunit L
MEGPTPVSALIHAATMVVAGVYLVARLFPLFVIQPAPQEVVTYVGIFSALFAATIACTQTDIKRVLAYSTMSQIGYMMFALGVSGYGGEHGEGYTASMFHLFYTCSFSNRSCFLCAGAIIHFVHSNEMKDMGGLRKLMPVTHVAFLIAVLGYCWYSSICRIFQQGRNTAGDLSSQHSNIYGGITHFRTYGVLHVSTLFFDFLEQES